MFQWLSRLIGGGAVEPTHEPDPFDVPQPVDARPPRSSTERREDFDENLNEARAIISQLEGLVAKMETKRQTKQRRPRRSHTSEKDSSGKGKERLHPTTMTSSPYSSSSSSSSSASPSSGGGGHRSGADTTTTKGGPTLIRLPPIDSHNPIVVNGMVLKHGQTWEGGEPLRVDDDDGDGDSDNEKGMNNNRTIDAGHRQPLRKSSPGKAARALRKEDYVLDDSGEWVKKDDTQMELTDKERSQPRLFLIRYLNPTATLTASKMTGNMRLVDGKWLKQNDESSEGEDIDFDAFGDDEELNKWGEKETYFHELPKEFDAGEENLNQWRRREVEHHKELGNWGASEKDPKRFLLDGLRQMYIIRVVDQANTKGRGWRQAKANVSPAKFAGAPSQTAAASAARVASRQNSGIPTKPSLDKFKDDGEFEEDLEISGQPLTPRRRGVPPDDSEEEVGFGDVSPPNSDPEDWGGDFASPVVNKLGNGVPAKSFEGIEIGDDDDDDDDDDGAFVVDDDDDEGDVMETDDNHHQDNRSNGPQQQQHQQQQKQQQSAYVAANSETNGGRPREEMDEDWGDEFAETELDAKFGSQAHPRLPGVTSIGDGDDDDEEGDDEFEELKQKVAHKDVGSKPHVDDDDEDWGMDEDDDNDKAVHVNRSVKKLIKDLVITDEQEESLDIGDDDDNNNNKQGHQSRVLSRHQSSSFNDDREDDEDFLMHNVGGIMISNETRKYVNRK